MLNGIDIMLLLVN